MMGVQRWKGLPEPLRRIVVACEKAGVNVTRTGKGHLRWEYPSGRVWCSASTSAHRGTWLRAERYAREEGIAL